MIEFNCNACGFALKVAEENAGKSGPCPNCNQIITAPTPSLSAAAAPTQSAEQNASPSLKPLTPDPEPSSPQPSLTPLSPSYPPATSTNQAPNQPSVNQPPSLQPISPNSKSSQSQSQPSSAPIGGPLGSIGAVASQSSSAGPQIPTPGTLPPSQPLGASWTPPDSAFNTPSSNAFDNEPPTRRPLRPIDEHMRRRSRLFMIAVIIIVGVLMPIMGSLPVPSFAPGARGSSSLIFAFPNLSFLFASGTPTLLRVLLAFPIIAAVAIILIAKKAHNPGRGIALASLAGVFFFILFNAPALSSTGPQTPMPNFKPELSLKVDALLLLAFIAGLTCLWIASRTRFYRPDHKPSYVLGVVGAVLTAIFLIAPIGPTKSIPILEPFAQFKKSAFDAIVMAACIGCILYTAFIAVINKPFTHHLVASMRARKASRVLLIAFILPVIMALLEMFSMAGPGTGGMVSLALTAFIKFSFMFGGILLLIPAGITDALVGNALPPGQKPPDPLDAFGADPF